MQFSKSKSLLVAISLAINPVQLVKADSFDNATGILTMNYVKVGK